jgi:hypothetical protein
MKTILFFLLSSQICYADMDLYIQGYSPHLHDRFYTGSDNAFVGQGYDWSGVGQSQGVTWATMISPSYFISAQHYHPANGSTITFYEDNTYNSPHTYNVDPSFSATYQDLYLGKLTTPIPTADHICYYPIFTLNTKGNDYRNIISFIYGRENVVGRNKISTANYQTTFVYDVYGSPNTLGDDECYAVGGDSGAPSFVSYNNKLAVLSTHSGNQGSIFAGAVFYDSFVHYGINMLNSNMVGEPPTIVSPIPGDTNLDGMINGDDLNIVLSNYNQTGLGWTQGDFDNNNTVNGADLNIVLSNYNQGVGVSSVPEPNEFMLFGIILLFIIVDYFSKLYFNIGV